MGQFVFWAPAKDKPAIKAKSASTQNRLAQEVRHQLVMLPYYDIFDNLEFRIDGIDTVVLAGQARRPVPKTEAEKAIRNLEGVGKVVNEIEVLPVSTHDEEVSMAAYRTIFSQLGLDRYLLRAVPPIHIVVKDGNLTLVGVVSTQADKDQAEVAARSVSSAFSVTNNLRVES